MSTSKLSIKAAEEIVGSPAAEWHGRCFEIASKLAPHLGGTAVYGHWLGPISPKAKFWKAKRGLGFAQHGWIVLPNAAGKYTPTDERVVDPTRWSFEAKKPYLFSGITDACYDEGGNKMREQMSLSHSRADDPDDEREPVMLDFGDSDALYDIIQNICRLTWIEEYSPAYPYLSHWDVIRLCNTSPRRIGWYFVAEVFEKIAHAGYKRYIPIDNWRMVDRYFGLTNRENEE